MSVKIRLARVGAKGQPSYRVVIADERAARDGNVIEVIGQYNPLSEPTSFKVDKDKVLAGKIGVLKPLDFSASKKRAPKGAEVAKEGTEAKPAEAKAEEKK